MFLLVRWLINAAALFVAAMLVPGIRLSSTDASATSGDWVTLAAVALIFGVVNAVIRPIVILLTLPIEIVTLGLFTFVINAFMLLLTSGIAQRLHLGFRVEGFMAALVGALVISVVSFVLNRFVASA